MIVREGQNYRDTELLSGLRELREKGVFYYRGVACMREFFRVMELFSILILVVVLWLYVFLMTQNYMPECINFTYVN